MMTQSRQTPKWEKVSRQLVFVGIILCLSFLVFLPALNNGFVWDDHLIVGPDAQREGITSAFVKPFILGGKATPYYRPVVTLSLLADLALWGDNPRGYHATNILFHVAASLSVLLIAMKLLPGIPALVAAAIFAVHPAHVEAVAFVSGRSDVLAGFLLLTSLALLLTADIEGGAFSE